MNCKKKYMKFRKKNISVGARSRAANWWLSPRHHSDEDSSMLRIPFPLTPLLSVVTLFAALQRPWPVKLLSADRPCACYRRPWFMYMQSMLISPIRSDRPSKWRCRSCEVIYCERLKCRKGSEATLTPVCQHVLRNLRLRQWNNVEASQTTAMIVRNTCRKI